MSKKPAFETARIELRMRSQNVNTVYINKITPPEYLIIQYVHGSDAPKILGLQGPDIEQRYNEVGDLLQRERPPEALREKLISKYTEKVFAQVFPGANPILPYTFADAGINIDGSNTLDDLDGWTLVKKASGELVEDSAPAERPAAAVRAARKSRKTEDAESVQNFAEDMI